MSSSATSTELWEAWLTSSLGHLRQADLLRTLRPVLPTLSAVEVHVEQRFQSFAVDSSPRAVKSSDCTRGVHQACFKYWQVLVPGDVLAPWIEDGGGHACQDVIQHGGALKLFSTNDYLGLSTHVALRRAAADAAMLYGLGVTQPPLHLVQIRASQYAPLYMHALLAVINH